MKQTRARAPEAKEARREQLMSAALGLFEAQPYRSVTMVAIAQRAGLAKGTTYIYFKTKEALFLSVVLAELSPWIEELGVGLSLVTDPYDAEGLARLFADSLAGRPALLRLLSLMHTVLEQNISEEAARDFKRPLVGQMRVAAEQMEAAMPFVRQGEGLRLLQLLNATIVGLFQATNPSPAVSKALESPDLAPLRLDFAEELRFAITLVFRGLIARSAP